MPGIVERLLKSGFLEVVNTKMGAVAYAPNALLTPEDFAAKRGLRV